MIVREPPYDLIVLFADDDAKYFFERIIERGQTARCLRKLRWASVSDPMHDSLCRNPERELLPYVRLPNAASHRYLLLWDHQGSGCENIPIEETESVARQALVNCGVAADRILAVAMQPELEALLVGSTLEHCISILSIERQKTPPTPAQILDRVIRRLRCRRPVPDPPNSLHSATMIYPKEVLEAIAAHLQIPYNSVLFHKYLGPKLPLGQLQQHTTFARLTTWLLHEFPFEVET